MKKLLFPIVLIALALSIKAQPVTPPQPCSELFFSELTFGKVPDGGTFDLNYAVEIFNPTQDTLHLEDYKLALSNSTGIVSFIPMSGPILPGDVYVVCNDNADLNLQGLADTLVSGLDFEATVILELQRVGGTVIDRIGQTGPPTTGSIDIVQLLSDPYNYLLSFHIDLNDYQYVDIRRGSFVDKGDPNFSSATSVIGNWDYNFNTDRSDIGQHYCVCNEHQLAINNGTPDAVVVWFSYANSNASTSINCSGMTNLLLQGDSGGGGLTLTFTHKYISGTASFGTVAGELDYPNCLTSTTICTSTATAYTISPFLGIDIMAPPGANFVGTKNALFKLSSITSSSSSIVPAIASGYNLTTVNLIGCYAEGLNEVNKSDIIDAYPIPFENIINLQARKKCRINIFDMEGQSLYNSVINEGLNQINFSTQPKGVYILKVIDADNNISTRKIIK